LFYSDAGYALVGLALSQVPLWGIYEIIQVPKVGLWAVSLFSFLKTRLFPVLLIFNNHCFCIVTETKRIF
jgi:hypothetical protein